MNSVRQLTRVLLIATTMLVVSGCASGLFHFSPNHIARQVEIKGQYFDKVIKYTGPTVYSRGKRSVPEDIHLARLYAERSKASGEVRYFVLADVLYPSGLRFYQRATFGDSSSAPVKTLWFAENPCTGKRCNKIYSVRFPVELPWLLNQPKLDFRLESFTGKMNAFSIPRNHIEGFVIATKKHRKFREAAKPKSQALPLVVLDKN